MLVRRRPELLEAQARADSSLNVLFSLILHTRGFYGMLMFPHHIFFFALAGSSLSTVSISA